ncbi:MAG TPA: carboxypeptidase-like regulatory domain-containing protein [Vicinamibacterales bacterium]|nr:carboxypeptidase-like regulatory domain-containing protein [Vicinamibacterales bacterium]
MKQGLVRLTLALAIVATASSLAFAQGGAASSITGVVLDSGGGAVPGATVVARNNATNENYTTVSGSNGSFTIPAISIGTYTVTVSLSGFKTAIIGNLVVTAAGPADVRATLEVGGIEETVTVEGRSVLVQTQATSVSTTIDINQVSNLPLVSRNALDFITFLPGVNTPGGNRNSTVNGLPQSTINITVDGMNIQDNYLKTTDGFFARMSPRLDAVEEVTVTSAAQGADAAGQGAIQIRFVTRSGSNTFTGSAYHYFRSDALNSKDWFTERDGLPKTELLQNQPGFRVGGPIVIPGVYNGAGRAFYFVNYEEFRQPQTIRRQRTILTTAAQQGLFSYTTSTGVRTVDVLQLAANNGHIASIDPIIGQLLAEIRAASMSTGIIEPLTDPSLERFTWNVAQKTVTKYPTGKVDYNVNDSHRLTFSVNYNKLLSNPDTLNGRDPIFPGFPVQGVQDSHRYTTSATLRSTIGTLVNEFRLGATGGPTYFATAINPSMWNGPVANQGGFAIGISAANINNPSSGTAISAREGATAVIENTVNWVRGAHSFNFGGSLTMGKVWLRNRTNVPGLTLDVLTSDPAKAAFSTAAFPGSNATQRGDAEDLYAVLVGRVSAITGNARIDPATNRYVFLGESLQEGRLPNYGFWIQDAWRPRPDLTVNMGLRYELQLPFYPLNDSYSSSTLEDVWGISGFASTCTDVSNITVQDCNLFRPGFEPGKPISEYYPYNKGTNAYNTDRNNFAPSLGVAWTPTADNGWLSRFLGQSGDTVFRAGFARSYNRPGMSDFTGRLDDNPGLLITVNRTEALGNLGTLPLLVREPERLGPAPFDEVRNYPLTDVVTGVVQTYDPNLQVPYADTWTAGWQRSVSRNMAVEARYVGTRSRDLWTTYNVNALNIIENGFFDEFLLAQQNLQANIAAGRGANFRYFGAGTGTSPLPVYLAYFSGVPQGLAGESARYTSTNFANATFLNHLTMRNPNPYNAVDALDADATRRSNALAAGLPANFIIANPDKLGGASIDGHGGYTDFHGAQFELRRRMAHGFQFSGSYAYGKSYGSTRLSFRVPRLETRQTGGEGDVTHALKGTWVFELPFGQGRRYASNVGAAMERLVGGWQMHGTARFQSGRMVNFGNVRMMGFDQSDLQDFYNVRIDSAGRVTMLPQDVIDNTVKAFSVDATTLTGYGSLGAPEGRFFAPANGPDCIETIANGFGDCGAREIVITGPMFKNVDVSVVKLVPLTGRVRAEFRMEILNAFNWVNYVPVTGLGNNPDNYEVTGLNGAVTARIIQLVSRVTW